MLPIMNDFESKLGEITERITLFSGGIAKDKLPSYLKPGSNFLGKYMIKDVIPYSKIIQEQLWTQPSVFDTKQASKPSKTNDHVDIGSHLK